MSSEPTAVVDTVVLRYFLFVDRLDLLLALLARPIAVPRVVFDPDEDQPDDLAACEITRSINYQRRVAADPTRDEETRSTARSNADALTQVEAANRRGDVVVLDLTLEEQRTMAALTSPRRCAEFGLVLPLDPGESACIALAVARGLILATDDTDALRALSNIEGAPPYERIRRLLVRAADRRLITKKQANALHRQMTTLGFRDKELPFP